MLNLITSQAPLLAVPFRRTTQGHVPPPVESRESCQSANQEPCMVKLCFVLPDCPVHLVHTNHHAWHLKAQREVHRHKQNQPCTHTTTSSGNSSSSMFCRDERTKRVRAVCCAAYNTHTHTATTTTTHTSTPQSSPLSSLSLLPHFSFIPKKTTDSHSTRNSLQISMMIG